MMLHYPLPYPQDPSPPPLVPQRPAELQYGNPYSTDTTRGSVTRVFFEFSEISLLLVRATTVCYCFTRPHGCCSVSWAHNPSTTRGPTLHFPLRTPSHAPESRPRGSRLGPWGGLHSAHAQHEPPWEPGASSRGTTKCTYMQTQTQAVKGFTHWSQNLMCGFCTCALKV